ncbi:PREDICTED: kinesin-like protein KIF23 isoform X2 [Polistes dominula]|uniref:Kinesin-like protein KIF23 isoform X2 n=1 Tax=Polistes dominula TaxID=743375 RepID=A0ABM1IHU0_POLDO|nr:PREDICTED: kinesin-like protein KIF23 isoform X2 [Polistes dominula]
MSSIKLARQKPPVTSRKQANKIRTDNVEPVQVYCRIRPMLNSTDISCMKIASSTTIIVTPPETAINFRNVSKVIQTSFSRVFGDDTTQKEIFNTVALPLVTNLINGENSLLFTYGVTGSGKTYTMTGNVHNAGIMPRCLDILFNSIANYQTKRSTFQPDRLNGFEILSETEIQFDKQGELNADFVASQNGKHRHCIQSIDNNNDNKSSFICAPDEIDMLQVDEDNGYAVFVTYIEIYNNSVYDLLEDEEVRSKMLQSKIIREDGNRNMYVHGVTEIEVKTSEEACKVFQRGQRRRRIAHTALNAESSRSHSIFTIRLVQAPLDSQGEQVVQDKRVICVSQLSLVDLAGTERTNRSKNTGQRLREAGNINNSLMTLRSCLEILRENQIQNTNKMIPYRDSKLTHLFKNYFDGEGQIRMIVCVNPRAEDYDETIQAMKFAEMTQEVQVARSVASKLDLGYTPGRRQANKIFKEARSRLEKAGNADAANIDIDIGLVYSLGGPFPDMEMTSPHSDQIITNLMRFLELRIQKRNFLRGDLQQKQNNLRNMLIKMDRENVSLKIENATLRASNEQQKEKISILENLVCKTEEQIDTLLYRLNSANDTIRNLQQELKDKGMSLNQRLIDKQKVKQKYNNKIQAETAKMSKELETKLQQQREILQNQMKEKENKLKLVKQILVDDNASDIVTINCKESIPVTTTNNIPETATSSTISSSITESTVKDRIVDTTPRTTTVQALAKMLESNAGDINTKEKLPVVNPRYRRSQSVDRWIDHRPPPIVPVGTILQPIMHRKRSVTHLTDPKDITSRASRYCLVSQNQDEDGELETKLYKGDILPTCSGGAQVVFNDMEYLKQLSPVTRKRSVTLSPRSKDQVTSSDNCLPVETGSKKLRI